MKSVTAAIVANIHDLNNFKKHRQYHNTKKKQKRFSPTPDKSKKKSLLQKAKRR